MEPATANTSVKVSDLGWKSGKTVPSITPKHKLAGRTKWIRQAEKDIPRDPDVLRQLPHETLMVLPEKLLNEVPVDRLHHLPEAVLANIALERLRKIPDITKLPPRIQGMLEERAPPIPSRPRDLPGIPEASSTGGVPAFSFEGPKTGDLLSLPVEEPGSTTVASEPFQAQLNAKFPPLPFRPLDARPRSGEYAPSSQSREPHLAADQENTQLQRRVSQPSSTHSRESQKRQSISRRQAVNHWLGTTASAAASQLPSGQHDIPVLSELMDLRAERDTLRDEKARLTDKVQEMELALWRDSMLRKEHEEKIAGLEKRLESERDDVREGNARLTERVKRMESTFQKEAELCRRYFGQFWDRIAEKDQGDEVVLDTLMLLRDLVNEYQGRLGKEMKGREGKEAEIQELKAELDGLQAKLGEKDTEMKDEVARLKSAHEKEIEEARESLLEQVRKLQKFGKDLHQKAKAAADGHQKELAEMESELETQHRDEMDKLISKYEQERDEAEEEKDVALSTMKNQHAAEVAEICTQHKDEISQLARMHGQQLAAQSQLAQQQEAQLHEEKMAKLERMNKTQLATESQLLKEQEEKELLHRERIMLHASIQQLQADSAMQQSQHHEAMSSLRSQKGHLRQAVDGDLRTLFQRLQFGIEVMTEPVNLGDMSLPPGTPLDPDGFVERNGENALRFLLRHIIWHVIMNGFFSAPFGFGVFGDGKGRSKLFELYATWRGLVASNEEATAQDSENSQPPTLDFGMFLQDPDANRWRSLTFASIRSSTITNSDMQESNQPLSPYVANSIKIKQEILGVLSTVTKDLPEEITAKVDEIVSLAGEIALEMGVHEAHLGLLMPAPGTSAHIGQEFIDCEDEYTISRTVENVELGVCPYFYRVGDGTGDFSATWAIARGKVYIKR